MDERRDEATQERPTVVVLDPTQPLVQAGLTRWLLDAHLQQRERAGRGHAWWCPCVRQN